MKNTKKIVSIISTTFISSLCLGLIVGFSVDWKNPKWIYVSGSSTVQPLINEISKIYTQAEVISEAGGSSTGIYNVVNYNKDVGATSREPQVHEAGLPAVANEQAINGEYSTAWNELQIKTITIGFDGIGLIYKFNNSEKYSDLVINNNNILNLYDAFTGSGEIESLNQIQNDLPNIKIRAYARTGGSNTSGTAEAFLKNSGFKLPEPGNKDYERWERIDDILSSGKYGPSVQQTAESNLITWSNIKANSSNNDFAYMTYLSAGFIKNNYDDILKAGFKVALYQEDGQKPVELIDSDTQVINVPDKYKWYRPLDLIVRLKDDDKLEDIKQFIKFIHDESLKPNSKLLNIYDQLGYIKLSEEKWNTMCIDDTYNLQNFWTSDYEIYKNQYIKRKDTKKYYGAR